ncbi:MAG: hypothetical protein J0H07_07035 [Sphingobacteriales bacterium]|nr:hypothetical protein [Sphingobacteriales bacterium]
MKRRNFIKVSGMAALSFYAPDGNAAGTDPLRPRPPLFQRGHATTYYKSKKELDHIGMPVGGIHTGTLYLGGDGRLWLWDIFNLNQEGVNPLDIDWGREVQGEKRKIRSRDGSAYVAPARAEELMPVDQGFAVRLRYRGKEIVRRLQQSDWDEVSFEATYPVATIRYTDHELPVEVEMKAYSPFIPLDEENSGLPATVFSILLRNKGHDVVHAEVAGWLENKTALYSARPGSQLHRNSSFREDRCSGVHMTVEDMLYAKVKIADKFDFGTMCLAALDEGAICRASGRGWENIFENGSASASASILQRLTGSVCSRGSIAVAGEMASHFIISWHTPNLVIGDGKVLPAEDRGRWYANRFGQARDVAQYVVDHFKDLEYNTLLWREVWYDSSLPYWFLERTFLNISTLATTTSHRFKSGRRWAWEGVGACEGNCTHVWQYAQATGRIFPSMERDNRERVDLGISLQEDGGIWFRGEYDKRPAIDGQAGRILGFYREHQMSRDDDFLKRNWEKAKRAVQFVIAKDRNGDGMEDTPLENTLDAVWDGEIAWIVGLCIAAVRAGQRMAEEMGDTAFAAVCEAYVQKGRANMEQQLFNGEYFIHRPDAIKGRANVGSYNTCHIDQVLGQSWAFQVGLGRILDKDKTMSALRALWKHNFMVDVGPYINTHTGWRPYALPGEGGMVMNTNPAHEEKPYGDGVTWQMGYFHECMSGFEHQVASHMMAEGMVEEAMTLTRAIHDRYHASKRNPFNEIECSDHYGRALASYGTFITACGFEYHGPRGYIRMAPKLGAENFKAPFTCAEGWGTYAQQHGNNSFRASFRVRYGRLEIRTMSFEVAHKATYVRVKLGEQVVNARLDQRSNELLVVLDKRLTVEHLQTVHVEVG